MARTLTSTASSPTRKMPATMTQPGARASLAPKAHLLYTKVTAHGKPVGSIEVFGERRAPARRAAFRQPPR